MRIGNLEFRKSSYLGEEPEHCGYLVYKWYPNEYYGRETEFIKDGDWYRPNNEHYNFIKIDKDCFKHPESCYTIAHWNWNDREGCYDFEFVGDRPIDLTISEWNDFKTLITHGFHELNPRDYEDIDDEF